jgi:MFS family permease
VLLVAAAAMVGTLPGRTQGLGLITEPLLADFRLDRLTYAQLNLWATIIGAAGALGIGRVIDRAGSRTALTLVAVLLGLVCIGMSLTSSFAVLALGVTLTRAFGQSALSVVSLAIVGHWFAGRINRAMALYSVVMSIGFMAAFPAVGAMVLQSGWRSAWIAIGLALVFGLAPLGWLIGRHPPGSIETIETDGYSWTAAVRTPAFWVFATGAALYGLVASGIGLFNESILAERGFGPDVYYNTLAVTAITALAGNFAGGWLTLPLNRLMGIALAILAAGLVMLPHLVSLAHVMAWATLMGLGGGLVMVLFFSVWPRVYGRRHLGRIQGIAQAQTVLASAIGPVLLAWCVEATGSYAAMFRVLAVIVAVAALAAAVTPMPPRVAKS